MKKYILFFLISFSLYLTHVYISGHGIYGDGNAYWAHAHSIFFQGNLEYQNIYHHLQNFQGKKYTFDRTFWSMKPTATGKLPNPWFVGTSLLWLPFLALAKITFFLFRFHPNPYSIYWEIIAGVSGIILSLIGLVFTQKSLRQFFSQSVTHITILTLFLSTNLFFYTALDPALSHSAIFFINSLFIYLFLKQNNTFTHYLALGLLWGLSTITRASGVTLGVLIVYKIFHMHLHHQDRIKYILNTFFGFTLGILPQLIVQHVLFGSAFSISYLTGYHGQAEFGFSYLFNSLFSAQRGLFVWTPLLSLAYMGIFWLVLINVANIKQIKPTIFKHLVDKAASLILHLIKPNRLSKLAIPFISYITLQLLFVGTWNGILSAGFSNRFFIETYPVLAFGIAYLYSNLKPNWRLLIFYLATYWNLALLLQFFMDKSRLIDQQGITYQNLIFGQIKIPLQTLKKLLSL